MAAKTIKVTGIAAEAKITLGDISHVITTEEATARKVTVAGIGTFDWTVDADNATFVADAALAGEYKFELTGLKVVSADFSKTTAGIQFAGDANVVSIFGGKGNDTLTTGAATASVNAGAGDDLVTASVDSSVTLGAGADTLVQSGSVNIGVADYSYADGDVISVTSGTVAIAAGTGDFSVNTSVTGTLKAENNWFEMKVDNGSVIDYHTAVDGGYAPVDVKLDLSKSRVQNDVDASKAKTADIVLGYGNDNVTLGSGADTITVSKVGGTDVITGWNKDSDVLVINGGKINKDVEITTSGGTDVIVDYANTTVSLAGAASASVGALNFNDGTSTQKVVFDLGASGSATLDGSADLVMGGTNTTVVASEDTHLHEAKFVGGMSKISVDSSLDKTINLTGNQKAANSIDASAATVGVQVWGYNSVGTDSIALGNGADTLWFGANDGTDSVTGFTYGTASDSDVLYLVDAESVKDIKVGFAGSTANFSVGNAVAQLNSVASGNDIINVKIGENVYKVAGSYSGAGSVNIDTDTAGAFDYYAFDASANNKLVVTGGKDFVVNTTYTDAYTTGAVLASVDASGVTDGNITIAGVANISTGAGTNNVWNYGVANATSVSLQSGAGTDTVWFADGIDTSVTVSNFETDDTLYFATSNNLRDIVSTYDFSAGASGVDISGESSKINLTGAAITSGVINLKAGENIYKAAVSSVASGTLTFASDVNVYLGGAGSKISVGSNVTDGSYTVRVGENSRGVDTADSVYISDSIVEFDASKSTAEFIIAGNSQADTTIRGGLTKNDLYGGGASSDTLYGNVSAIDTFWFGTGDGNDAIFDVNDDDTVNLWNVDDADIQNITIEVGTGTETVILSDSSALTITDTGNAALTGGLTFTSAQGTAYTYDSESKKLVEKKA